MFCEDVSVGALEKPFVFHWSPRTLQAEAASQCALICLRHYYFSRYRNLYPDETPNSEWFWNCESLSCDIFQAPKRIVDMIRDNIKPLKEDWMLWVNWSRGKMNTIFGDFMLDILLRVKLRSNGEFYYKPTVQHLLRVASTKWTVEDQYRIACLYCCEDDVERLWPLIPDDSMIKCYGMISDPIIAYWNYRMNNELDKVPGDKRDSPELRMILSQKWNEWSQVIYFWDKMSAEERMSKIVDILRSAFVTRYMLPKLNISQLEHVFKVIPHLVIANLAEAKASTSHVSVVWNYVKNTITEDQFEQMLRNLWRISAFNIEYLYSDNVSYLCSDIWDSAPDHLRKHILNKDVDFFSDHYTRNNQVYDAKLILDLLAYSTRESRLQIWNYNKEQFIQIARMSDLSKAIELCFDNQDDLVIFKQFELLSEEALDYKFEYFIEFGSCDEFVEYLRFCLVDEQSLAERRKQIIDSKVESVFLFDLEKLKKFNGFIDDSFPSQDSAERFKEKLLLDNFNSCAYQVDLGWLIKIKEKVDLLLPSEDRKVKLKRKFYQHCESILRSGKFKTFRIREWEQFLKWCAPDQEQITKLKNSLRVDDIFKTALPECIIELGYLPRSCFPSLGSFLRWYFGSKEATKMYKVKMIRNLRKSFTVMRVLEGKDKRKISVTLNWIFDDDVAEIEKFLAELDL